MDAVIFDVGGVLIRTVDRDSRTRLEQRLGLAAGESETLVFNSDLGQAAQRGEISSAALWAWVQQHLGLTNAVLRAFQHDFFGGDRLDVGLVDYIRGLKGSYRTAIISNAMDNLLEIVTYDYPMADAFDLIVGSAYERVMKPDAAIFLRTLERLGCQPEQAVFVDDFAHNVAGAQAVGMHAIHYIADMDLPAALARLGVVAERSASTSR